MKSLFRHRESALVSPGDGTPLGYRPLCQVPAIAADTRVDRLTIEWPSGRRQVLRNPAVDGCSAVEPS
jgi:ASPIC and UnbV